jgi:hypothetical protein
MYALKFEFWITSGEGCHKIEGFGFMAFWGFLFLVWGFWFEVGFWFLGWFFGLGLV